jgi:hypothetical protein
MTQPIEQLHRDETVREETPIGTAELLQQSGTGGTATKRAIDNGVAEQRTPLFEEAELADSRQRWQNIQADFVDDPRNAVRRADELVATLMKRLAEVFAAERSKLEHEWDKGENVSTEDLRQALRRYRSFFDRLLSV